MIIKKFKKHLIRKTLIIESILSIVCWSCKKKDTPQSTETLPSINENIAFEVHRAPKWTKVFKRDSGWFGGDGIFSIPFSGKEVKKGDTLLFVFSDTMIGRIQNDSL